jgi:lysozyme
MLKTIIDFLSSLFTPKIQTKPEVPVTTPVVEPPKVENMPRQVNKDTVDLVKSFEGFFKDAYLDPVNIPTIGYGTIQYPPYYLKGRRVRVGDPTITEAQAVDFMMYELNQKAADIENNHLITKDVTDNQFGALVSFAYNVGTDIDSDDIAEGLGDSTLLKKVNADPNDPTIRTEFMKWVNAGGKKLNGLVRRRGAEADLYFKK